MSIGRLLRFGLVFALGAVAGAALLQAQNHLPASANEAQRHALRLLDQSPPASSVGDNRIVAAVQKISPAVVNIDTVGAAPSTGSIRAAEGVIREVRGKGSGVILTSDGYIITNNHVIEGANRIRITTQDNHWYYAQLVGRDAQTDIAVLHITANGLPTAELGDSDKLQVGEWAVAVGNPLGLGSTITVGVISALNRRNLQIEEGRTLDGAIQTDAAINRGNSGGALANINGQLVGINTAILSSTPSGGNIGLGFAIPSATVRRVARDIIANGEAKPQPNRPPWLGIQYSPVPAEVAMSFRLAANRGVMVDGLPLHSPAEKAGLQEGDIILMVDGKEIGDPYDVREAIRDRKVGDRITLHIVRPEIKSETKPDTKKEQDIAVTLEPLPDAAALP